MSAADLPMPARPAIPECHDDVCITCSDTASQVRVVELLALDDAALLLQQEPGDGMDDSGCVRAAKGQDALTGVTG